MTWLRTRKRISMNFSLSEYLRARRKLSSRKKSFLKKIRNFRRNSNKHEFFFSENDYLWTPKINTAEFTAITDWGVIRKFYKFFPRFFRTLHIFSPKILRNFEKILKIPRFWAIPEHSVKFREKSMKFSPKKCRMKWKFAKLCKKWQCWWWDV